MNRYKKIHHGNVGVGCVCKEQLLLFTIIAMCLVAKITAITRYEKKPYLSINNHTFSNKSVEIFSSSELSKCTKKNSTMLTITSSLVGC